MSSVLPCAQQAPLSEQHCVSNSNASSELSGNGEKQLVGSSASSESVSMIGCKRTWRRRQGP
eukprot:19981-Heterococcus_DN1.PRE.3